MSNSFKFSFWLIFKSVSFNKNYINKELIQSKQNKILPKFFISLPPRKKEITILRAPFIHSASRNQYCFIRSNFFMLFKFKWHLNLKYFFIFKIFLKYFFFMIFLNSYISTNCFIKKKTFKW